MHSPCGSTTASSDIDVLEQESSLSEASFGTRWIAPIDHYDSGLLAGLLWFSRQCLRTSVHFGVLIRQFVYLLFSLFFNCTVFCSRVSLCCDRKSRAAYAESFALWQQATIEITCHDHSSHTLLRSIVDIVSITRDYTPRSLYYCLFAPHICMVLFFTHIPFVVNNTNSATPPERLQQHPLLFTTNRTDRTFFV